MPVLRLTGTDPYLNLATEEWILNHAAEFGPTLLFWRDDPCVVIGRHQNPWVECDMQRMRADGVPLVRRISGGGAVYHDPGNTNFSFIAPAPQYDQRVHVRILLDGLTALGIPATANERNDLLLHGRKVSGSAYRHSRGNSLHHGTLLINADLDRLLAYLAGSTDRIASKATASVRSKVANLDEARPGLSHEETWDAIEQAWRAHFGESDRAPGAGNGADRGSNAGHQHHPTVPHSYPQERGRELREWSWLYGHTPKFTDTGSLNGVPVELEVRRGHIDRVRGDISDAAREALIGSPYDPGLLQGD